MIARLLVTVLIILTLAPAAEATCAWVLWSDTLIVELDKREASPLHWYLIQAEATEDRCQRVLNEYIETRKAGKQPGDKIHGNIVVQRLGVREVTTTYRCFPDTIDPRGPKGGGR